jgi:urease accessory protein
MIRIRRSVLFPSLMAVAAVASTVTAHAHSGAGHPAGYLDGFVHPLAGVDHLAAMLAVGLWAAQCGGRARWLLPLSFLGVISIGGLLGGAGMPLPFVESAIAASVLVLGLAIAASVVSASAVGAVLVGLFALFHGHAHGTEIPAAFSVAGYAAGFISGTALLHGLGLGLGMLAREAARPMWLRYTGAGIAMLGLFLLAL